MNEIGRQTAEIQRFEDSGSGPRPLFGLGFPYSLGNLRMVDRTSPIKPPYDHGKRDTSCLDPRCWRMLHQAKGSRCTSVQYPLYFGLVNCTLAYFHKFPPSTCRNMDYRDISLPNFGIFRIRAAISVRSTGLSRFDRQTSIPSQIRHVWAPGVGGLLHQAKGYRCTSVQYPLYFGLLN
jgi:hypothetical protein